MKRFLFIVLLLATVAASARRTTWNIRLGAGMQGSFAGDRYYPLDVGDMILSPAPGMEFLLQPNIGLGDKKKWVFSPALQVATTIQDDPCSQLSAPLLFGYRIKIGNRMLFVPKIGPYVGIVRGGDHYFWEPVVGPMLDLAFEFGHFVVGLDAYYSFISQDFENRYTSPGSKPWDYNYKYLSHEFNPYGVNITLGYKF